MLPDQTLELRSQIGAGPQAEGVRAHAPTYAIAGAMGQRECLAGCAPPCFAEGAPGLHIGKDAYLEFKRSYDPAVFKKLESAILSRNFQLVVCYCSIFDDCWKSDLTTLSLTPARVKSCEAPKVPFDQGLLGRRT